MDFQEFRKCVNLTIEIVSLDLDQLQGIAENANSSSTTTIETTNTPWDDSIQIGLIQNISRCTIPIAMVCFSVIDMFGQWLNGKRCKFDKAANAYFRELLKKDDLKNTDSVKKFKEYFRNGVMHSFFAAKGFGVKYSEYDGNSLFLDIDGRGSTLDVRYLLTSVRRGLKFLSDELENGESKLSQKAFEGFKDWHERWNKSKSNRKR